MFPTDAGSSPRRSRTWAVLMTYFTRKWACVLVAIWLLPLIYSLCVTHSIHSQPQLGTIFSPPRVNSLAELEEFARSSPADGVDVDYAMIASGLVQELTDKEPTIRVSQFTGPVERQIQPALARLQKIGELSLRAWFASDQTLRQLSQLHSIDRLEIDTKLLDAPLNLAALGSVRVRVLELRLHEAERTQVTGLDQLTSLEELRFTELALIPPELLRQAAQLPKLRMVEIPYRSDLGDKELSPLKELSASRSLKRVEAGCTYDAAEWLRQVREQVRVPVHANQYDLMRRFWILWGFNGLSLASTAFCGIAMLQLSLTMAEMLPRYKPAHEWIVWSLIAGQILLETWRLVQVRGSAMAAISLYALMMIAFWLSSFELNAAFLASHRTVLWIGLVMGCVVMGGVFFTIIQPVMVDAFLMGQYPWVTLVFCLGAVACGLRLHQLMPRLSRAAIAANINPVFISNPWSQEAQAQMQRRLLASGRRTSARPTDPVERAIRGFSGISVAALVGVILWRTGLLRIPSRHEDVFKSTALMLLSQGAGMNLAFFGMKWWQRMAYLATEMVRPPIRSHQLSRLFWNVARDFWMVLPMLLALAVLIDGLLAAHGSPPLERSVPPLLLLSGLLASYALIMWLLPVRSGLKILVILVCLLAVGVAVGLPVLGSIDSLTDSASRSRIGLGAAGIVTVVSLLAILGARERYNRLEWGKML